MLDIQALRENINTVAKQLATRGYMLDIQKFNAIDQQRKVLQIATQDIQNQRNTLSKEIGIAKSKGVAVDNIMTEVAKLAEDLKLKEQELADLQLQIQSLLLEMPNLPHISVPQG